MKFITQIVRRYSDSARSKRALVFRQQFDLGPKIKILDIGSENGSNINMVLKGSSVTPSNVYIADIKLNAIEQGRDRFGYNPILIPESGKLPFPDSFFDIVYCSSVIEHATGDKSKIWEISSGKTFKNQAIKNQTAFANEIIRLGKRFFVQTPYKYFPIESHSWMPLTSYLPRFILIKLLKITNLFWIKRAFPDWNLLNKDELSSMFPDAKIIEEKSFFLTKSLMAVHNSKKLA